MAGVKEKLLEFIQREAAGDEAAELQVIKKYSFESIFPERNREAGWKQRVNMQSLKYSIFAMELEKIASAFRDVILVKGLWYQDKFYGHQIRFCRDVVLNISVIDCNDDFIYAACHMCKHLVNAIVRYEESVQEKETVLNGKLVYDLALMADVGNIRWNVVIERAAQWDVLQDLLIACKVVHYFWDNYIPKKVINKIAVLLREDKQRGMYKSLLRDIALSDISNVFSKKIVSFINKNQINPYGDPYYESIKLKQLCAFLDQKKSTAMETLLVDMYSKCRMTESCYEIGESFFSCFEYYDAYCYRRIWDERINKVSGEKVKSQSYFGGTRELKLGCEKICCSKYPLFKYQRGMYIAAGMHGLTRAVVSEMQGVTLHFKFFPDFAKRVCVEVEREEHFGKAKEYKAYKKALEKGKDILFDGRSIRYTGSRQMLQLGFMRNPYEDFRVESIQ